MELKISKFKIVSFCIFFLQFISLPYFKNYNYIRNFFMVLVFFYVLLNIEQCLKLKYLKTNSLLALFSLFVLYSSAINKGRLTQGNSLFSGTIFLINFFLLFLFVEIAIEKNCFYLLLNHFYKFSFCLICIADSLLLFFPSLSIRGNYFLGNKFDLVYFHLLFITLFKISRVYMEYSENKMILYSLYCVTFLVSLYVNCATGLVGLILLILFDSPFIKNNRLFYDWKFYLFCVVISFLFVILYESVLSNGFVEDFIVSILKRDITLTSRTNIYKIVPIYLKDNLLFGFGYGSSYEIGMAIGNFPNTQNAILEWLWQSGIITTTVMIILFNYIISKVKYIKYIVDYNSVFSLLCLLYVFTFLGAVEITMNRTYFGIIALIFGCCCLRESLKEMENIVE